MRLYWNSHTLCCHCFQGFHGAADPDEIVSTYGGQGVNETRFGARQFERIRRVRRVRLLPGVDALPLLLLHVVPVRPRAQQVPLVAVVEELPVAQHELSSAPAEHLVEADALDDADRNSAQTCNTKRRA